MKTDVESAMLLAFGLALPTDWDPFEFRIWLAISVEAAGSFELFSFILNVDLLITLDCYLLATFLIFIPLYLP